MAGANFSFVVAVLLAALGAALALYTWPSAWLDDPRALTSEDPALAVAAAILLGAAAATAWRRGEPDGERAWGAARRMIAEHVAVDLVETSTLVNDLIYGPTPDEREDAAHALARHFGAQQMEERLKYLSASLSPSMTIYMAEYMERRIYIAELLAQIDVGQLLLFTDRDYFQMRSWRLSELPKDIADDPNLFDHELCIELFGCLEGLTTLALREPIAGWRRDKRFSTVYGRLRDMAQLF